MKLPYILTFKFTIEVDVMIFWGVGDLCDDDADGDGVPNDKDNCPLVSNPDQESANKGENARGKACEYDFDGDGTVDAEDICPERKNVNKTDFGNIETIDLCKTVQGEIKWM